MMQIFIRGLVDLIEKEDRHWRTNTLFFWDGAAYHDSTEITKTLRDLNIPILILGPYSYLSAPCELTFGQFKNTQINKEENKMGKR
jgi:hypothetical protein